MAMLYKYDFENVIRSDTRHPMHDELKDNDSLVIYAPSESDARRQLREHVRVDEDTRLLERNPW